MGKVTSEEVNSFLQGRDPMERIVSIECNYTEPFAYVVYAKENGEKRIRKDDFKPFVWAKYEAAGSLYGGDKQKLKSAMRRYGIGVKGLMTSFGGKTSERNENGYRFLFYARSRMSYANFQNFFQEGGVPLSDRSKKVDTREYYMSCSPVEQYMISNGKRLFKGYENYNDLVRFIFDLETQGLNPLIHRIEQIGIHTNNGVDEIIPVEGSTPEELDESELNAIDKFVYALSIIKPDVVIGHNSENFDWNFIITRCEVLGTSLEKISKKYFKNPIYKKKKQAILKLGGEMEYYYPTVMWGHSIIDSLHAARRAQALDSNMKSSNLKYLTKYLSLNKDNRVYIPGDRITLTWNDTEHQYAFNNSNGDWYQISDEKPLREGYEVVTGRYIGERYLLDDLWETDKVEEKLNESNFLVAKIIPTSFSRVCTMGTAGIWKLIMLAWSYENDLAIPSLGKNRRFVGGLSRLLLTGYTKNIVKLDFNSLYPSIILTWNIDNSVDIMNVLNTMLDYVLTNREKYKGLKAEAGARASEIAEKLKTFSGSDDERKSMLKQLKKYKIEKTSNDKKQLPLKIFGNSYFGSAGAEHLFPWGDNMAAEMTTCIGRQCLRLMISHFRGIGYEPVVGDSFTGDTPLFIKYDDTGLIDIKPIEELIGDTETDVLGREYDTSEKPFSVLCRSGWVKPEYIYRHRTDKPLYEVSDGNMSVMVTEDHSLFNDRMEKIKPNEINNSTHLEYFQLEVTHKTNQLDLKRCRTLAKLLKNGTLDRVPMEILNASDENVMEFLDEIEGWDYSKTSKTCRAGVMFLRKNKCYSYLSV